MSERNKYTPDTQSIAQLPQSRESIKPKFNFNEALNNLESRQTPTPLAAAVFDQIITKL